jgi:hypothetical protein
MSRVAFYIYKELADGKMVLDRDVDVSQLRFFRDGILPNNLVPFPQTVNNGDGTYFFTPSGSGNYSVELNFEKQDEFYNIYITDSDNLDETRVDGTSITTIAGDLALYSSSFLLYTGSLINDLTSHADSASLAANQGRVMNFLLAGKLNANDTFLKEGYIVDNFVSASASNQVQSAESMLIDFSNTNYIAEEDNYVAALRKLDTAFQSQITGSTIRKHYFYGYSGSTLVTSDTDEIYMKTVDRAHVGGLFGGGGYYFPEAATITRMCAQYLMISSSATTNITFWVKEGYLSGASVSTGYTIYMSGSALGPRSETIDFNEPMRAGRYLGCSLELDDTSDTSAIGSVSVILEVTI